MKKIDRRSFLKVLGIAGAACAMTALTGCDDEGVPGGVPAGDGSTPLSYLKPFNGSVVWNNITPEDPFGNIYSKGVNYMVFRSYGCYWTDTTHSDGLTVFHGKVEYLTDKKYRKLTMNLNPYKYMGEVGWGKVNVYVDGKLQATSPEIVQKTRETVKFEVDISGAEYIMVEPVVRTGGERAAGEIIMWDVKLWK